jgi:hypothetical protein
MMNIAILRSSDSCFSFLVLRSLENHKNGDDYLKRCNLYGLNPLEDNGLSYYRALAKTYHEIVLATGEQDSCINSWDYQLRSGAFSALQQSVGVA